MLKLLLDNYKKENTRRIEMPYRKSSDLPKGVKSHLPPRAQEIYRKAYNAAYEEYASPSKRRLGGTQEEASARVAWAAVKQKFSKRNGEWVAKTTIRKKHISKPNATKKRSKKRSS
jgi:cation transport regulator